MKTTKKNIFKTIWFATIALLLAPVGCSDFLEKPLQGQLTQTNFPTTANDALLATTAAYTDLRNSAYHFGLFPIMDIMSDDARKGSNPSDQGATIGPYDNFTHISSESSVYAWWSTLYHAIRTANVVLERVPAIAMDPTLKARYIGEASFLRALYYFDLARGYGGVPLPTTTTPPTTLARANLSDVYALIISDLQTAIAGLPEKSAYTPLDLGRASKGAANALLAKVYLFMPQSGILNYVPQPDFVNAEKYALAVINSGQYGLEADFVDANGVNGNYGTESVFEIGSLGFEGQDNGGDQYGNVQGVRGNPNRGWGFNRPSEDLKAAYESGDPRQDKTIIKLGDVIDGILITGDGSTPKITIVNGVTIETQCYNRKVWTPGINVPSQFAHHRRLLRYADVLLIAAEASNENGKTAQALLYLNMVRARARNGNNSILLDITQTDQTLLRAIILKERRIELALEGNRFFDLIRTGNAKGVLGPLGFKAGQHELLAIPQTEIDLSHHVITQNQGWE